MIEILIVISILVIMSIVGMVSLQPAKNDARLRAAQREVAATIKMAQSYALQGRMQNGKTPCEYGVQIPDSTHYTIFYRIPMNWNVGCSVVNPNSTTTIEQFALTNGVILKNAIGTEIVFEVPFGNIKIGDSAIILESPAGSNKTKTINIYQKGESVKEN